MRSLLLVPLGEAAVVEAALRSEADALVFDLPADGPKLREGLRDALRAARDGAAPPHLFVRLAGLDRPGFDADLDAALAGEPDGILLADSLSGADVQQLGAKLAVVEAERGLESETGILAEAGALARGLFGLAGYRDASPRLMGLTWTAERLAADLGSDPEAWTTPGFAPFETARALVLFGARAAEVAAIDTPSAAPTDAAFAAECRLARRQGFNAKLALTAAQAAIVNAIFGVAEA